MRDLTRGNITKNILLLSWPTMIAMLFHVGFNIVDTIFVGRLGAEAIAAVSVVFPLVFFMFALAGGLGIGTTSVIARYFGAKKYAEADNVAEHSVIITLILAVIFTILGLLFSKDIFALMGVPLEVMVLALKYSRWIFGFSLFMFLSLTASSILRGEGNMKAPMIGMVVATIINIILDPILIFGYLGAPAMGIDGAALATVISRFIASIIMVSFIFSPKMKVRINMKHFKFNLMHLKEILRVGIPSSLNQSIMSISIMIMTRIIASFGAVAIAVYGIGFRIESLVILPVLAIATSVITIVGQNVGANKFDRAEHTVWKASKISVLFVITITIIFVLFPRQIFGIFSNDPQLIAYGVFFLRILGLSYIFAAVGINIGSAFQGAGFAMPALILTSIRVLFLAVPLALLFAFKLNYGLNGVWIGIAISSIVAVIISIIWFKLGTWKKNVLQ